MGERPDLADILHSPLDEPEPPVQWLPLIGGILAGGLVVIGGYLAASGGDDGVEATALPTTVQPTTSTQSAVDPAGVAFPTGYEPLSDISAGKPLYAIEVGDDLVISVATATRRGLEADSSFSGGEWLLETATSATLMSTGVVFDAFLDGAFSVVFPTPGEVELRTLRLVERWSADLRTGSATVEPVVLPGAVPGDVSVDLGGGVALRMSELQVTASEASLSWELTGADAVSDVTVFVRAVSGDRDLAVYFPGGRFFDARMLVEPSSAGRIDLQRDQGVGGDIAESRGLVLEVDAALVLGLPGNAEWDLTDLPIVTR